MLCDGGAEGAKGAKGKEEGRRYFYEGRLRLEVRGGRLTCKGRCERKGSDAIKT